MIPYICDINNNGMTTRICDNCRFLYSNMEQTREWCSKKSEGTRFTREYTKEYIDLRLNAEIKNCKGYDK